jgi:hypothetical protein
MYQILCETISSTESRLGGIQPYLMKNCNLTFNSAVLVLCRDYRVMAKNSHPTNWAH